LTHGSKLRKSLKQKINTPLRLGTIGGLVPHEQLFACSGELLINISWNLKIFVQSIILTKKQEAPFPL
jgi:hypothetical protein